MNDRIKAVRLSLRLSQAEFGARIKLSQNYIWMIEKGERAPSDRTISDICREFHVSENWLRTGEGDMNLLPESEAAMYVEELLGTEENPVYDLIRGIMKTYIELDPSGQKVLEDFARELRDNLIAKNEKSQG